MPFRIMKGDLAKIKADAIVNPTDSRLSLTSLKGAASPSLQAVCWRIASTPYPAGSTPVTLCYGLPTSNMIHIVTTGVKDTPEEWSRCYERVLKTALECEFSSVAIPLFPSAGETRFSSLAIYSLAEKAIRDFTRKHDMTVYLLVEDSEQVPLDEEILYGLCSFARSIRRYALDILPEAPPEPPGSSFYESFHNLTSAYEDSEDLEAELSSDGEEEDENFYFDSDSTTVYSFSSGFHAFDLADESEEPELPSLPESGSTPAQSQGYVSHGYMSQEPETPADAKPLEEPPAQKAAQSLPAPPPPVAQRPAHSFKRRKPVDPNNITLDLEESFAEAVMRMIKEKGMTDPQCYTRANLSRAVFNKLKQSSYRNTAHYRPSKATALALIVALELPLDEAKGLLEKAGYALSRSDRGDIIVEYFLTNRIYDIFELNEVLFHFDQSPLGSF